LCMKLMQQSYGEHIHVTDSITFLSQMSM
jgi:hypothetical protein